MAPLKDEEGRGGEVEEAYRLLVDSSLQGLLLIQEGGIVFANRMAAEITGYTVPELLTTTLEQVLAFVHPEDRAMVHQRHEDRLAGRPSPSSYEFRAISRDGGLLWLKIEAGVVEYRGRPAIQIALTDITAHKQTEQTLRETESRLQDLAATIPGAVFQFQVRADNDWEILFMSGSAAALFEIPARALTDLKSMAGCICPEDCALLRASVEESRRTLSPWTHEVRIVTGSGRTKWLNGAFRPRGQPNGSVLWNGVLLDITDRKRAEEELQRQNTLAQSYLDTAAVMMIAVRADEEITLANRKACEILGCTPEEVVGKNWFDTFVPQDDREKTRTTFRGLIAGRIDPWEYVENHVLTRAGQERLMAWHNTVLRDDQGRIVATLSSGEDITDRRRAEEALQASEARYRAIVENSLVGIGISKGDQIVYANRSLLQMYGYDSLEEFAARLLLDHLTPASRALVEQRRERLRQGEEMPSILEHDIVRKDGAIRTLQLNVSQMVVQDSVYTYTVFVDITERKQSEASFRESEERFRSLIEGAPEAIFVQSEGRFVYVNPSAVRLFGAADASELIGRPFMERMAPEYHEAIRERIRRQRETGRAVAPMEQEYLRLDGSRVPVETTAVSIRFQGRDAHLVFIRDITERRQAQEALRENEERLTKAFRSIPDALIISRLDDGKIVEVNDGWHNVFGCRRDEAIGKSSLALNLFADPADRRRAVSLLREQGFVRGFELQIRQKSGAVRTAILSMESLEIRGEQYMLSVVHDITERKQAEEALRKSEAELRAILDATPFPVALVDVEDNQIDFWSRSALALFGHTAPTAPEWYQIAYPDPAYRSEVLGQWKLSLEKARRSAHAVNTGEYRVTCHDGSVRLCELYAAFLADRLIVTFSDITERKQAEEVLRAHRQQLRVLASELSLAEERERRRIAMLLHDHTCQNLVLARMKLEELRKTARTAPAEEWQGISDTLNDTIEGVRELTFDLSSPTLYRFGLEAALEELLEDKFGAEQGLEYSFSDDHAPKPLAEDVRVLLFRSVRELLVNVIKHARARQASLDIRRVKDSIEITVTDDGVGCDVSGMFATLVHQRHFGLLSVRERLEHVGGRLEICSQVGRGSRFTLLAPLDLSGGETGRSRDGSQDSARG